MLFYVDVADGDTFTRDDEGFEFSDLNEASQAAVALLPEIARDAVHGPHRLAAMMEAQERYIAARR